MWEVSSLGVYEAGVCLLTAGLAAACWLVMRGGMDRGKSSLAGIRSLREFNLEEVLKDEDDGRVVTLLGRFTWQEDGDVALVKLIATPLTFKGLRTNLGRLTVGLKSESGAEYAFYDCSLSPWQAFFRGLRGNSYSLEIVAPASERTVNRNRPVTTAMLTETAEMYTSVTVPHIDNVVGDGKSLSWLYNVLSKEKEADRVLYEDEDPEYGFLLNVDTKWRTHPDVSSVPRQQWHEHPSVAELYCLAICHRRDIRTLRDLRAEHVPMLKEMYRRGIETIEAVYGVPEEQLRVFVHYMPQFYHFHVHFTRVHNTIGVEAERAHLLVDIIQNLEMAPTSGGGGGGGSYYETRTMQFRVRENDALHKAFKEAVSTPRPLSRLRPRTGRR
ncbi:unnamed protein product [Scytosiphon promiscuus]